ncbi:MAG: sigma-54 dependent transcriptional regulator [Bdellovibrionota bacterium]
MAGQGELVSLDNAAFRPRVLVVDDSEAFRSLIEKAFSTDYDLSFAADEATALEAAKKNPHLILLDLHLPPDPRTPRVGLSLLSAFGKLLPGVRVIVVSGTNERRDALRAVAAGASDFYTKPIALDELRIVIKRNLQVVALEQENQRLSAEVRALEEAGDAPRLIGSAPAFLKALELIGRVAPTDATVLLSGENGTGKELFAREIHRRSARVKGPFVVINCGAIPESLAEGELFGFVKGAFTGAVKDRMGRFQAADGGTLFLDEIGELSENLQVKLLRFLQEKQIEPLGANRTVEVDARLVTATNRDLSRMVAEGKFREDLFYRLNVIQVRLPSLRERREDIAQLAQYFLRRNVGLASGAPPVLSEEGRIWLENYSFPGNVRELENMLKRAVLLSTDGRIFPKDLVPALHSAPAANGAGEGAPANGAITLPGTGGRRTLSEVVEAAQKVVIEEALAAEAGNLSRAALRLQVERKSLQRLINRLGVDVLQYCPQGKKQRGRPPARGRLQAAR